MKNNALVFSLAAAALLATLGPARAFAQEPQHDHQHQATPAPSSGKVQESVTSNAAPKTPMAGAHEGMADMKATCDMHRKMMSSGSPTDREAMMNMEMKGMSAEQKQQHIRMMDEMCK